MKNGMMVLLAFVIGLLLSAPSAAVAQVPDFFVEIHAGGTIGSCCPPEQHSDETLTGFLQQGTVSRDLSIRSDGELGQVCFIDFTGTASLGALNGGFQVLAAAPGGCFGNAIGGPSFGDMLTIVSDTLPAGTPVSVQATLILNSTVVLDGLPPNCNSPFVEARFRVNALTFLSISDSLCVPPPDRTVRATVSTFVGGTVSLRAELFLTASAANSESAPSVSAVATGNATYFVDMLTPDASYQSASGVDYRTP